MPGVISGVAATLSAPAERAGISGMRLPPLLPRMA